MLGSAALSQVCNVSGFSVEFVDHTNGRVTLLVTGPIQ